MNEEQFAAEIDSLTGINAGLMLTIAMLVKAQPDQVGFHIELMRRLEQQLAGGSFSQHLSPVAQDRMRSTVEWIGSFHTGR